MRRAEIVELKSVAARVARCEVDGIGADGTIHYKIGIVFNKPIPLPEEELPETCDDGDLPGAEEFFDGTEEDLLGAVERVRAERPSGDRRAVENRW